MKLNELLRNPELHGLNHDCQVKQHPDYPRYWITDAGQVLTCRKTWDGTDIVRHLSSCVTRTGYIDYLLVDRNGKRCHKSAHRLVAELFGRTTEKPVRQRQRKISAEQEKTIIEKAKTMSQRELSAMYNVSYATINQIVRLHGGVIARKNLPIETRLDILARFAAGDKPADLARQHGVTIGAIGNMVRRGPPKRK